MPVPQGAGRLLQHGMVGNEQLHCKGMEQLSCCSASKVRHIPALTAHSSALPPPLSPAPQVPIANMRQFPQWQQPQ